MCVCVRVCVCVCVCVACVCVCVCGGVECGGVVIPGLLFTDDTSLLASDGPGIKNSLDVLVRWCDEWGVKMNVQKSGIMHI